MNSPKHGRLLVALLAAIVLVACAGHDGVVAPGQGPWAPAPGGGNGSTLAGGGPGGALPEALGAAFLCETQAEAFYGKVIAALGPVMPFVTIQLAEVDHLTSLAGLYTKRGLELPTGACPADVSYVFETLPEACSGAAALEAYLVALYAGVETDLNDVDNVVEHLGAASTQHELAFERCLGL